MNPALALLLVAGGALLSVLPIPSLDSHLLRDDNTYWWCEMHHAPRNIQVHSISSIVSQAIWGPTAGAATQSISGSSSSSSSGAILDRSTVKGPVRTPVIAYNPYNMRNGSQVKGWTDSHQSTFWCEMHSTGGDDNDNDQDWRKKRKAGQQGVESEFGGGGNDPDRNVLIGFYEKGVKDAYERGRQQGLIEALGVVKSGKGGASDTGKVDKSASPRLELRPALQNYGVQRPLLAHSVPP